MSAPLVALLLTAWLGGTAGLVCATYWLIDHAPIAAIAAGVATLFVALFGLVVFVDIHAGDDGVARRTHMWQGGSGPRTVCNYQTRTETVMIGKTPTSHQVRYTVCADAG